MNINLTAFINSLSYGLTSINLLKQLDLLGHNISLFPIGHAIPNIFQIENTIIQNPKYQQTLIKTINNAHLYDKNAISVRICHQNGLANHVGKYHVGFPIFELDTFNNIELNHLSSQDMLLVCSHWAKSIIESNNIKITTKVVPLGCDELIFYPKPNKSTNKFRFCNFGKWELRKGHHLLIECFNKAFTVNDDVELIMCPYNHFLSKQQEQEWINLYKNSPLGNKIFILDRLSSQEEVSKVMNQCDAAVFPALAEGWNLELLECMGVGLDVITTNYSAPTEYASEKNSYLIYGNQLEEAFDGIFFKGNGGNWLNFENEQKEQLIEHMRFLYKNQDKSSLNKEGIETGKQFSWTNSANALVRALEI